MATASAPLMTTEQLLAMPDDGVERWLIRGQLRESREDRMTKRDRFHSRAMARVAFLLEAWLENQPEPRGQVFCGEAGVRLRDDPDTTVGVDVVYVTADVLARQTEDSTVIQ